MKKQKIAARVLGLTGFRSLLSWMTRWTGVLTLNYHRIGESTGSPFAGHLWSATTRDFEAQIEWLKSRFTVISPDMLAAAIASRKGQYVLITFDDGYRDNYTNAFPILKRHKLPATFFVTTGFIDNSQLTWWDEIAWMVMTSHQKAIELPGWLPSNVVFDKPNRERAIRTLSKAYYAMPAAKNSSFLSAIGNATGTGRYCLPVDNEMWMTWDMIREMRAAGMFIGGHTVNHPVLGNIPHEEQRKEIETCGRRLEEELGEPMRLFSYPYGLAGDFGPETKECLRAAGVRFAFSYYGGYNRFSEWDDYDIRRTGVERFMTVDVFKSIVDLPRLFGTA